jgi:hypothetical protein
MPRIAVVALQTMMPGNAAAAQQMTMPHIKVAAWLKISRLLHCPLALPSCSLVMPPSCCASWLLCGLRLMLPQHQPPLPPVSIVHCHHRRRGRCHRAATAATATTVVKLTIVHGRRKKQQQHHHQQTNSSTNVKTFTSPDNLDLFNLPTVSREINN